MHREGGRKVGEGSRRILWAKKVWGYLWFAGGHSHGAGTGWPRAKRLTRAPLCAHQAVGEKALETRRGCRAQRRGWYCSGTCAGCGLGGGDEYPVRSTARRRALWRRPAPCLLDEGPYSGISMVFHMCEQPCFGAEFDAERPDVKCTCNPRFVASTLRGMKPQTQK